MVLHGHRSIVNQVRYNKNNNLIASSGVEKMVKVRWLQIFFKYYCWISRKEGSISDWKNTRMCLQIIFITIWSVLWEMSIAEIVFVNVNCLSILSIYKLFCQNHDLNENQVIKYFFEFLKYLFTFRKYDFK